MNIVVATLRPPHRVAPLAHLVESSLWCHADPADQVAYLRVVVSASLVHVVLFVGGEDQGDSAAKADTLIGRALDRAPLFADWILNRARTAFLARSMSLIPGR